MPPKLAGAKEAFFILIIHAWEWCSKRSKCLTRTMVSLWKGTDKSGKAWMYRVLHSTKRTLEIEVSSQRSRKEKILFLLSLPQYDSLDNSLYCQWSQMWSLKRWHRTLLLWKMSWCKIDLLAGKKKITRYQKGTVKKFLHPNK